MPDPYEKIKEYYPGYRAELQTHVKTAEELRRTQEQAHKAAMSAGTGFTMPGLGQLVDKMAGRDRKAEALQAGTTAAKIQIAADRESWRALLLQLGPVQMSNGRINTLDDLLNMRSSKGAGTGFTPDQTDIAWAEQLYGRISYLKPPRVDTTALLTKAAPQLVNINNLTSSELVKALSTMAMPEMPAGVTTQQLRDAFAEMGFDTEALDNDIENMQAEVDAAIESWADQYAISQLYVAGLLDPERLNLSTKQRLLLSITQPMLSATELFTEYAKYWSDPIAGLVMTSPRAKMVAGAVDFWLGTDYTAMVNGFSKRKKEAQEAGMSWWMASGYAYEHWETSWLTKIAVSTLTDPITYIGLGLATRVTAPLPTIGKFVAAFEQGWNRAWGLPIAGMRKVMGVIPKTLEQRAALAGKSVMVDLRASVKLQTGIGRFSQMRIEDVIDTCSAAYRAARANPRDITSPGARLGLSIQHAVSGFMERDTLQEWAARVGGGELTDDAIFNINWFIDVGPRTLTSDEMAPRLLEMLGGRASKLPEARQLLDEMFEAEVNAVEKLLDVPNVPKLMKTLQRATEKSWLERASSPLASDRLYKQGMMGAMMRTFETSTKTTAMRAFWGHYVDRMVVLPFARHYLLFASYGPMNLVESAIRGTLDGHMPWQGFGKGIVSQQSLAADAATGVAEELIPMSIALGEIQESLMELQVAKAATTNRTLGEKISENIPGLTRPINEKLQVPGLGWRSFKEMNEHAARVSVEHRAYIWRQDFMKELYNVAPEQMDQIGTACVEATPEMFPSFSKSELKAYNELVRTMAQVGPDEVRSLAFSRDLIVHRKLYSAASELLDNMPALDEAFKVAIRQDIADGNVTSANVLSKMGEVLDNAYEHHVVKLARASEHLDELTARILNTTPADREELLGLLGELHWMANDALPSAVHDANTAITLRGHRIVKAQQTEALHREGAKQVDEFIKHAEESVRQIRTRIRDLADTGFMSDDENTAVFGMLDRYIEDVSEMKRAQALGNKAIADFVSTTPPKQRTLDAWSAALAQKNTYWDEWRASRFWRQVDNKRAADLITPDPTTPNVAESAAAMRAGITPDHVAQIFGVSGDEIRTGLLRPETMTMLGRQEFINEVRAQASRVAAESNLAEGLNAWQAADELGFTEEAVSGIYDSFIRSSGIQPRDIMEFAPMEEQLKGFAQSYQQLWDSRMIPEEELNALIRHTQQIADNLSELPMFRTETYTPGAKPVKGEWIDWHNIGDDYTNVDIMHGDRKAGKVTFTRGADGVWNIPSFFPLPTRPYMSDVLKELNVSDDTAHKIADYILGQIEQMPSGFKPEYVKMMSELYARERGSVASAEEIMAYINKMASKVESETRQVQRPMLKAIIDRVGIGNEFKTDTLLEGGENQMRALHKRGYISSKQYASYKDVPSYGYGRWKIEAEPPGLQVERFETKIGPTDEWKNLRNSAAEKATYRHYQTFTDYDNANVLDNFMKQMFPFWTYESQRWPWSIAAMGKKPALGLGIMRYMDYTDGGYLTVPGTDLQINPFRGTIFMGGFRRLWMKDFPEYYDRVPWGMAEGLDYIGRFGFYPGAQVTVPLALFGGKLGPQLGDILTPGARTLFDTMEALPGKPGAVATELRELFFSDRFKDYQIMQAVTQAGSDGMDIWAKKMLKTKLTEEEEAAWRKGAQRVGVLGVMMEQTALFRFRPEDREKAYDLSTQFMSEVTGVPVEEIERINRLTPVTGKRFTDLYPLSPLQQYQMRQMEQYQKWNRMSVAPLLPSEWGLEDAKRYRYYKEVEQKRQQAKTAGFPEFASGYDYVSGEQIPAETPISYEWLDAQLRAGTINGRTYIDLRGELAKKLSTELTALSNSPQYKDVAKTLDQRLIMYEDRGRPSSTYSPAQEFLWMYYDLTPEFRYDPDEGWHWDFDEYFAKTNWMKDSLPEHLREEFFATISKDWTPMHKMLYIDSTEYMNSYNNSRYLVMAQFTPEQQSLISRYMKAPESAEAHRIKSEEMFDADTKLIAHYNELIANVHTNMRLLDPELDGRLRYWGKVTTSKSQAGEDVYLRLVDERS